MPRIRTLKPEIWLSPQVMNLARDARLLFLGLITQADDEGRGSADPRKLKGAVFPGDDDIGPVQIVELEQEISGQRLAVFYDSEDHGRLYQLLSWKQHQRVEKPRKSAYPAPPKQGLAAAAGNDPGMVGESDGNSREESGRLPGGSDLIRSDPNGSEGNGSLRAPAALEPTAAREGLRRLSASLRERSGK